VWLEPGTAPHHLDVPDNRPVIRYHTSVRRRPEPLVQIAGHGQWLAPLETEA
jgi:hypothetical protein